MKPETARHAIARHAIMKMREAGINCRIGDSCHQRKDWDSLGISIKHNNVWWMNSILIGDNSAYWNYEEFTTRGGKYCIYRRTYDIQNPDFDPESLVDELISTWPTQ